MAVKSLEHSINERIRCRKLLAKVTSAEAACALIEDGMTVATSGFTPSGSPKAVPKALAERVKTAGERVRVSLLTGASVSEELDGLWAAAGITRKRMPYQANSQVRELSNDGSIDYVDIHLSHMAQELRYGFYGPIHVAIIEAVAVTPEGHIVPTTSVGNSPTFAALAEKLIIEVNVHQPMDLLGIHDIYVPEDPPRRLPIPILHAGDRIGTPYVPVDLDKVAAVVISDEPEFPRPLAPVDEVSKVMAGNLIDFLENEIKRGKLPATLLPLQSGVGSVANAVLAGFKASRFEGLEFYSEVVQDAVLDLIDAGKVKMASATGLAFSPEGLSRFFNKIYRYRHKIILRPQEISNSPEVIRRLGIVAMNTALEADIYGNVNSTHVFGSRVVNGIGGSGDFARNAYLSIFTTPSVAKNGKISCIVPMVSHVDHTEHDVHVLVTEQGVADLRGLPPRKRARLIIESCAHPDYRPLLREYLSRSERKGGRIPHILAESFFMHERLAATGSMLDGTGERAAGPAPVSAKGQRRPSLEISPALAQGSP